MTETGHQMFEQDASPTIGQVTMEAYIADMRDEVEAAVAEGLLVIGEGYQHQGPPSSRDARRGRRGTDAQDTR